MASLSEGALTQILQQTQQVSMAALESAIDDAVNYDGLASQGARQPDALEILRSVHRLMVAIGLYNDKAV